MKTTLTQAWEARGLSGMMLRAKVSYKLIDRFFEDPERKRAQKSGVGWVLIGIFDLVAFLFFFHLIVDVSAGRPFPDVSQTVTFLGILAIFAGFVALTFLIGYCFIGAYRCFAYVGLADRYVFQHRDDEVEL